MSQLSRRDILKLSAALLGGAALSTLKPLSNLARRFDKGDRPNFIILVLDAMSARNLSTLGYARQTTPALEKFASQSTVYHNHYAGGNFTTPGTSTILTGLYPWTHRAISISGMVSRAVEKNNIFALLGSEYTRVAFTQNQLAYILLGQFSADVDQLVSRTAFTLQQNVPMPEEKFVNDPSMAYYAFNDFLNASEFYVNPASISLGLVDMLSFKQAEIKSAPGYPRGYPYNYHTYFRIEDALAGLAGLLRELDANPSPFFTYFHLLPPHEPYNPRREFIDPFLEDGFKVPSKPRHPLTIFSRDDEKLSRLRLVYDSFIANVDYEVDRFISALEKQGILDSSYLIITSDHGELFERGEYGHGTALVYDPVAHVPLMIRAPGQTTRRDVHSLTSNADLLPTILSLAGREIPSLAEGRLLPGLGGEEDSDRSVFTVFAKENSAFLPLNKSVMSMRKDDYQLLYYRGYPGYDDKAELYHLGEDPEELRDLSSDDPVTTARMKDELLELAHAADSPYQRKK